MARFMKGQSGNPGGRPRIPPEVRELARAHTVDAIQALVKALKGRHAVQAAVALLDRGWGKPPQSVTAQVEEKMTAAVTYDYSRAELVGILDVLRTAGALPGLSPEDEPGAPEPGAH